MTACPAPPRPALPEDIPHPWAGQEREQLREMLATGGVKLGIHIRKMNAPGSPVYQYMENVVPAGAILLGSFLATTLVHFYLGTAVLALGCWWWIAKAMPRIRDGVFERTAAHVLASDMNLDLLWAKGMLSLYAKRPDGTERVATRRDDWRAFVRSFHGEP